MAGITPERAEYIEDFHKRTYKRIIFTLRKDEDADIIKELETAREHEIPYRTWLRELYDNQKGEK